MQKQSFSTIDIINDDILDARCSLHMPVDREYNIILIPVMGAIRYKCSVDENLVAAG